MHNQIINSEVFGTGKVMTVEFQFDFYLKQSGLDKAKMPPIQLTETRRAFYAAFLQLITLFGAEISKLPEDDFLKTMDALSQEAHDFWAKEAAEQDTPAKVMPLGKGGDS